MKTLSPGIQAILQEHLGLEPVNVLEVQWVEGGTWHRYSDKYISDRVIGRILEISTLESVVKLDSQGQSQGISVILSDSDGELKNIFDQHDIHGRRCRLMQWFDGLAFAERFQLYEGEISSPIVWKEGDRTLSFEVITKLSDKEVGFSPEEGFFQFLPEEAVGVPWPLAFGKVGGVPATLLTEIPNSVTAEPLGVTDPSLSRRNIDLQQQIWDLEEAIYAAAIFAGAAASRCSSGLTEWCAVQQQYEDLQKQYADMITQMEIELMSIWSRVREQNEHNDGTLLVTNGENFPQGEIIEVQVEDALLHGYFDGNTFHIESTDMASYASYYYNPQDPEPFGFTWYREGSKIRIRNGAPVIYIANLLPSIITMVQVMEQTDNGPVLITVPTDLYASSTLDIGPYVITYLEFSEPPSSYNANYSDEIYVTMTSNVGPNTVDILIWLIETYTELDYDTTSFDYVRDKLENYPSNFALLERRDIIQVLEEIAFQARCSIWISDNTFYIKYLSEEVVAVDTISEDDIDVTRSFDITLSNSEELVTKLTANWYYMYTQEKPNRVVVRHNVKKYGTREREIDFYIYNIQELVIKSATFWLIRMANMWKFIEFTTYIDKLAIETFDTVEFDFAEPFVADSAVKGVITENTYDSNEKTVTMKAWLPVRAGEMEAYDFAEPANIDTTLFFPTPLEIAEGFAGGDGPGEEVEGFTLRIYGNTTTYSTATSQDYANRGQRYQRRDWGDQVPSDLDDTRPDVTFAGDVGRTGGDVAYSYGYDRYELEDQPSTGGDDKSRCYPGVVMSSEDPNNCQVNVYENGLINEPTSATVTQLQIGEGATIPPGTWVLVAANDVEMFNMDGESETHTQYTMQVPVWL